MYNILKLKQDLTGVIHGTTLNKIQNLNGNIDRAARQLLADLDPQETKRTVPFATPIFDNVYTYPLNVDVKGNAIIDIRPQVRRGSSEVFNQDYNQQFSLGVNGSLGQQFTISWNQGVRTILVNNPLQTTGAVVNYASGLTDNGTWTAGGTATNLAVDNVNWIAGGGSLKFDMTLGAANLATSNMPAVNLTDFLNQSTWFVWTYLPTASDFTSIVLQFGSSASDYYTATATLTQANTAFQDGWNLLSFNWVNLGVVGSPNPSAITYLNVIWNGTGTDTGVRLNDIVCQAGQIFEYEYYSKYLFRDSITGAFQETVTDDGNLINLDTDSYNLLFNQVAFLVAQQLQGLDAEFFDYQFFQSQYVAGVARYKANYKSEKQKPHLPYYTIPKPGYGSFLPRRWNR